MLLADDNDVHGSYHPILRVDTDGNTYQRRTLDDGTEWDVLKNSPDREVLERRLGAHGARVEVRSLQFLWMALGRT